MKMFIDCNILFSTQFPALECMGRILLIPVKGEKDEDLESWKIWVLSTWVEDLKYFPINEDTLTTAGRDFTTDSVIETDVCIIGAGSA